MLPGYLMNQEPNKILVKAGDENQRVTGSFLRVSTLRCTYPLGRFQEDSYGAISRNVDENMSLRCVAAVTRKKFTPYVGVALDTFFIS